jgi:hypothetical protein
MRSTFAAPCGALLLLSSAATAIAEPGPSCTGPLLGTWVLLSMETEDKETGQKMNLLGVHPSGYLSYGSDCRVSAILVKESRAGPASLVPTDAEGLELYRGLISYAGSYAVEGSRVVHHIEASWNQAWTATNQAFQFRIDGTSLFMTTGPGKSPLTGRQSSTELIWTKVE